MTIAGSIDPLRRGVFFCMTCAALRPRTVLVTLTTFLSASLAGLTLAQATPPSKQDAEAAQPASAAASAMEGFFLLNTLAPGGERSSVAVVNVLGGYDSSLETADLRINADIKIIGPLDLCLGLNSTPNVEEGEAQPRIGARVRILNQAAHFIDLSAALMYRMERFTDDEGFVQGMLAGGRRFGRFGVFGNSAYGQDPEGDDRLADFSLATLYALTSAFQVGFEAILVLDLLSNDPKREERKDAEMLATVGPVAHWSIGAIGLTAQAGYRSVKFKSDAQSGAIFLAGLSYAQ